MALQGRTEPVFRLPLPRDSPGWQRCSFPTGLPRGRGRPVLLGRGSGPGAITTDSCHPMPCPRSLPAAPKRGHQEQERQAQRSGSDVDQVWGSGVIAVPFRVGGSRSPRAAEPDQASPDRGCSLLTQPTPDSSQAGPRSSHPARAACTVLALPPVTCQGPHVKQGCLRQHHVGGRILQCPCLQGASTNQSPPEPRVKESRGLALGRWSLCLETTWATQPLPKAVKHLARPFQHLCNDLAVHPPCTTRLRTHCLYQMNE